MRTYICLITDDRYAVPSLVFQGAQNSESLRDLALAELRANPHYQAFEARFDDATVFQLSRQDLDAAR